MAVEGTMPEVEHGGPDWGMPSWANGGVLPAFTHIDGRNVALVDAGEYRALLALAEVVSDPERLRLGRAAMADMDGGQVASTAEVSLPLRVRV